MVIMSQVCTDPKTGASHWVFGSDLFDSIMSIFQLILYSYILIISRTTPQCNIPWYTVKSPWIHNTKNCIIYKLSSWQITPHLRRSQDIRQPCLVHLCTPRLDHDRLDRTSLDRRRRIATIPCCRHVSDPGLCRPWPGIHRPRPDLLPNSGNLAIQHGIRCRLMPVWSRVGLVIWHLLTSRA